MNLLDRLAYDTGGYTVQEILSSFCNKILEIIDLVNKNEEVCDETRTIIENIRNEVVPDLVDDIMEEMQDNGYFDSLVNVTLIDQLRTELNTLLNDAITDYTTRLNNFNSQLDNIVQQELPLLAKKTEVDSLNITKATKLEVDIERKRIDSFTSLTQGSTTGDAELIDGRIGVDGTVYDNIGSSIRNQVNCINTDLHKLITPLEYTETVGYYFGTNGELIVDTTSTKCCYTNKISVLKGSVIEWSLGKYQYPHFLWGAYILYDENENIIGTRKDFINTSVEDITGTGVISIPNNAKYIAFTYRTFNEHNMLSVKNLYSKDNIEQLSLDIEKNKNDLGDLKYFSYDMTNGKKGWIRHGTGQFNNSDATKCYVFNKNNLTHLKAFLKSDTDVIDGISFFSGAEISENTYLQSSIAWKGNYPNGLWYDIQIPQEANLICVTSSILNGFIPKIMFLTDEILGVTDNKYKDLIELNLNNINVLQKDIQSKNNVSLYGGWTNIYHFGMDEVAIRTETPPVIPSQTIYDVRYAKKLGYRCIEANLHKTSDGQYVTTHGLNGALGHDFDDLEGNDAYGVVIGDTTLESLRTNYRYRSSLEKYKIPITTLEEFCGEAKKQGLVVMLQYVDKTSLEIAKGILGSDNLIMYNAPRSEYNGAILEYLYYDTKEEILNRCKTVGKPYIYSMDNPSKFDDSTLKDIVSTLHNEGYYVASAYVGNGEKYIRMGFDFIARDGKAKELEENQFVLEEKILTFNQDGSVTWNNI